MKVRLKSDHWCVKEVQHPIFRNGKDIYLFTDGTWCTSDAYEPVPTETWRDVTGECDTEPTAKDGNGHLRHLGRIINVHDDYRLRKVPTHDLYMTNHQMAFIVEKRNG